MLHFFLMPSLTKSKFKLALDRPTKLYYSSNQSEYEDQNVNDEFLQALAEGGYQVGELAKDLFCNDPISENISISELAIHIIISYSFFPCLYGFEFGIKLLDYFFLFNRFSIKDFLQQRWK